MIVHDVRQNGEQWEALRRGMPTASEFHRIICPSEGTIYRCAACCIDYPHKRKKCPDCAGPVDPVSVVKASSQADDYMFRLIAESMSGTTEQRPPNFWMERGHELESEAVKQYEFLTDRETDEVGFCTTDDGLIGASPDRLVGPDGLLEAKSVSPAVHVRHMVLLDLEDDHKVQVQGQMLVTGRQWADVISYCPGFPDVIIHVERNESYIGGMNELLVAFVVKLQRTRAELIAKYGDFRPVTALVAEDLGVSDADVSAIWQASQEAQG